MDEKLTSTEALNCGGLLLIILFLFACGCSSIPEIETSGKLAGQDVLTAVDSEIAKCYLEDYLKSPFESPGYAGQIKEIVNIWNNLPLNTPNLKDLSEQSSPDFATMYFVDRIYHDPANQKAQDMFHSYLDLIRHSGSVQCAGNFGRLKAYLFAFVPGYAYKSDATSGADFARQRSVFNHAGIKTCLIETGEFGMVEDNASIVADEIIRLSKLYNNIIIVSVSKGGPEVSLAIRKLLLTPQLNNIKAWISVGGILRGSPVADQYLTWPRRWIAGAFFSLHGWPAEIIKNLSSKKRQEVFAQIEFPKHILTLQYIGVPLSGQVSSHAKGRYKYLRRFGPNDGLTTLADQIVPGGIVITDLGLDHYYLDPEIDIKSFALAYTVVNLLER